MEVFFNGPLIACGHGMAPLDSESLFEIPSVGLERQVSDYSD